MVLTQNIELNPYTYVFDSATGLIFCYDKDNRLLYGVGTGMPTVVENKKSDLYQFYYGEMLSEFPYIELPTGYYEDGYVKCGEESFETENWEMIGTELDIFEGTFNGNGHWIHGLFEFREQDLSAGLFRSVPEKATIKNLSVGGLICAYSMVGSIAGYVDSGVIENCTNEACIIGNGFIGGITGEVIEGMILDCTNGSECGEYGTISGEYFAGGVVGKSVDSYIAGCENYSYIYNYGNSNSGGIVGGTEVISSAKEDSYLLIEDCHNYGKVLCDSAVASQGIGGITGSVANTYNQCKGVVTACKNYGDVTSNAKATGGIVGMGCFTDITKCTNEAQITGKYSETVDYAKVGGIIGYAYGSSEIIQCNNSSQAKVEAEQGYCGGIAGHMDGFQDQLEQDLWDNLIDRCENSGMVYNKGLEQSNQVLARLKQSKHMGVESTESIESSENVEITYPDCGCAGGIVGFMASIDQVDHVGNKVSLTEIRNCSNRGTVENLNAAYTGGIVGFCQDQVIQNSCNLGTVNGQEFTGGLCGGIYHTDMAQSRYDNCFNSGTVSGQEGTGGVIGKLDGDITSNNWYAREGCVIQGSGGVDGIPFQDSGTIAGDREGLSNALNLWIIEQSSAEQYEQWSTSQDQASPYLDLQLHLQTDRRYVKNGDVVTFILVIENTSERMMTGVTVSHLLPAGLMFQAGSVKVNGVVRATDIIGTGVGVTQILSGESATISYQAVATFAGAGGSTAAWETNATVKYRTGSSLGSLVSLDSNACVIEGIEIALQIRKTASVAEAESGDLVTYKVVLENQSDVRLEQIVFRDVLPDGTELVPNSLYVDQQQMKEASLKNGILTGPLDTQAAGYKGNRRKISYTVKVSPDETLYTHQLLKSMVEARYTYQDPEDGSIQEGIKTNQEDGIRIIHPSLSVLAETQPSVQQESVLQGLLRLCNTGDKAMSRIRLYTVIGSQIPSTADFTITNAEGTLIYERKEDVSLDQVVELLSMNQSKKTLEVGECILVKIEIHPQYQYTYPVSSSLDIRSFYDIKQDDGKPLTRRLAYRRIIEFS